MESLKNKHIGETLSIVGKGPSLQFLTRDHFEPGPIITMNQAIITVEDLDLPNPIYSMQKDGGPYATTYPMCDGNATCEYSGNCGDECGVIVRPRVATLLVHTYESRCCFPDYKPRVEFNVMWMGFKFHLSSFFVALRFGNHFGCTKYNIISCDAISGNDNRTYIPNTRDKMKTAKYGEQKEIANVFLPHYQHKFITPRRSENGTP